jgi:hypothetical protein
MFNLQVILLVESAAAGIDIILFFGSPPPTPQSAGMDIIFLKK